MGRQRTGWVRNRDGAWRIGFTLRSGKQYERLVPPPTDNMPVDEAYATRLKNHLLAEYARGAWDPEAADGAGLPGDDPTVLEYLQRWAKTLTYESAPEDRERIERYVAPAPFGRLKIRAVKPRDAAAFIEWLKQKPSGRGGTLAPRSVRNIYDVVRRGHDAATFDELLSANPFAAVKGRLPTIADKNSTAREGWYFTHEEIAQLLTDTRVPSDRRIVYAMLFLTGARFGEMAAMRWRDWDPTRTPLQRITITRAIKSVSKKEGGTKTGARKLVPVHPVLQRLLEAWRDGGWQANQGRTHGPDDLMFPNQNGDVRDVSRGNRDFKRDLVKLTLRERHQYVTRHAFITLAQDDGGDPAVLKWVTHAPPRSAFDGYTREQWDKLCREVAKLKVALPGPASAPQPEPEPDPPQDRPIPTEEPPEGASSSPAEDAWLPPSAPWEEPATWTWVSDEAPSASGDDTDEIPWRESWRTKDEDPGNRLISGVFDESGREDLKRTTGSRAVAMRRRSSGKQGGRPRLPDSSRQLATPPEPIELRE